jgi:hypothetical protein
MWVQILFFKISAQLLYFLIFFQNFVLKLYAEYFFPNISSKIALYFLFFTNLII